MGSCCAPPGDRESRGATGLESPTAGRPEAVESDALVHAAAVATMGRLLDLPGGRFRMGGEDRDANRGDGEGPVRELELSPFRIGATQVTNSEFGAFVAGTGYRTGAERFGWSFVFAGFLPAALRRGAQRPDAAPWWCRVDGATWAAPEGPCTDVIDRAEHPAVHVDHADALAYCAWAGLRLPTEAEWEYAARGGLDQARYPWGDELTPEGEHRCNIWQGRFPARNTVDDGFAGTCPVDAFAPNGFGLFGSSGNVWEWCDDWWSNANPGSGILLRDPTGPASGINRVMRGGSYLCHESYCNRYRVAARTSNDPGSSSGNVGFRVAADA